jgi:WD40 repeat protein
VAVFGDGTIGSWNTKSSGEAGGAFFGNVDHQYGLYGIDVSHDATLVAVAFWEENTIEIWDVRTKKQVHSLTVPNQVPESILFLEDTSSLYVGSNGGRLTKIEIASGQEAMRYIGHSREVLAIALSPDESQIVSGDSAGKVIVWDAETAQPVVTLCGGDQPIRSVDWSVDGNRIVAGKGDGTVQIWTLDSSAEPKG